jgi:hypothetical protein
VDFQLLRSGQTPRPNERRTPEKRTAGLAAHPCYQIGNLWISDRSPSRFQSEVVNEVPKKRLTSQVSAGDPMHDSADSGGYLGVFTAIRGITGAAGGKSGRQDSA